MKVLLISGHGNGDVGACGCGYQEYQLTRELVNLVASELRKYCKVDVYDQNRNAFMDVQNGTFNIGKYDYVFEIHFNAFNGNAHGTECFVTYAENGISVEQDIMRRMKKYFTLRDNDGVFDGVKRMNFLVINTCRAKGMSAALLETCFIDNQDDMNKYQSNKNSIAKSIAEGIAEGFGLVASVTPPKLPMTKPSKEQVARDVLNGMYGNGVTRKANLEKAGYNYDEIQAIVNRMCGIATIPRKSNVEVAKDVINGKYGNGAERKRKLESEGYNYQAIQDIVNRML